MPVVRQNGLFLIHAENSASLHNEQGKIGTIRNMPNNTVRSELNNPKPTKADLEAMLVSLKQACPNATEFKVKVDDSLQADVTDICKGLGVTPRFVASLDEQPKPSTPKAR